MKIGIVKFLSTSSFRLFASLLVLPFFAMPIDYNINHGKIDSNQKNYYIPQTAANTITVNTLEDSSSVNGNCSLREAITASNANTVVDGCQAGSTSLVDSIIFIVNGKIMLNSPLPDITNSGAITINGGDNINISGNVAFRVFTVDPGANATLMHLTISDALETRLDPFNVPLIGGGVYSEGAVAIDHVLFTNNICQAGGGAIGTKGGTLDITNSSFTQNKSDFGGAIYNRNTPVTIDKTTFDNNHDLSSAGDYGGAIAAGGTIHITKSTFSNNTVSDYGGAIWISIGTVTVDNTTFSGNGTTGANGGGGAVGIDNGSSLFLQNSTLVENSTLHLGSSIFVGTGLATITNSIISSNQAQKNCSGAITENGFNIDNGSSCGFKSANHSLNNTNPMTGPFGPNSGLTYSYSLLPGSPAIDAGYCIPGSPTDQRDMPRPQGTSCDIGAFEFPNSGNVYLPLLIK